MLVKSILSEIINFKLLATSGIHTLTVLSKNKYSWGRYERFNT